MQMSAEKAGRWDPSALGQYRAAIDAALARFPSDEEFWLLRGAVAIGSDGVAALNALPLTTITQSPAFRVHASESLGSDTLKIYERS